MKTIKTAKEAYTIFKSFHPQKWIGKCIEFKKYYAFTQNSCCATGCMIEVVDKYNGKYSTVSIFTIDQTEYIREINYSELNNYVNS